jgi:hypothetical protein
MSGIKRYISWCEDKGYVNESGEVESMDFVDEYLQTKEFEREQREQALKVALSEADEDSLFGMMHKLGYLVQRHKDLKGS